MTHSRFNSIQLAAVLAAILGGASLNAASAQATNTIYVSNSTGFDFPGQGGPTNPYRTISYALQQESGPVENVPPLELIVAAGDYSSANGETFPLNLVPGTSIFGAEDAALGEGTIIAGSQGGIQPVPLIDIDATAGVTTDQPVLLRDLEFVTATQVPIDAELAPGSTQGLDLELDGLRFRSDPAAGFVAPPHLIDYFIAGGSSLSLGGPGFPAGELIVRDCFMETRANSSSIRARVLSSRARVLVEGSHVRGLADGLRMTATGAESELSVDIVGTRIADCKTGLMCRALSGGVVTTGILNSNFVGNGVCDQVIDFATGQVTTVPRGAIEDDLVGGSIFHSIQRCVFFGNGTLFCTQRYDLPDYRVFDYELADNTYSSAEPFTTGTGLVGAPGFVGTSLDAGVAFSADFDMHLTENALARNLGTTPLFPRIANAGLIQVDADGQAASDPCGDGAPDAGLDERREALYALPRLILGTTSELRILGDPGRVGLVVMAPTTTPTPSICPTQPEVLLPGAFLGAVTINAQGVGVLPVVFDPVIDPALVGIEVTIQGELLDTLTGNNSFTPVRTETLHAQ